MANVFHTIGHRQVCNIRKGDMIRHREVGLTEWCSVKTDAPSGASPFVPITVQRPNPAGEWIVRVVDLFQLDLVEIQVEVKKGANFAVGVDVPLG
ncbi:hypothetical protein [Nakamurella sp.]|uniref:hypothetical protein n=1 Tax=Nakamurella sp. TaxID=1869182 RepID=UPI00378350F5